VRSDIGGGDVNQPLKARAALGELQDFQRPRDVDRRGFGNRQIELHGCRAMDDVRHLVAHAEVLKLDSNSGLCRIALALRNRKCTTAAESVAM